MFVFIFINIIIIMQMSLKVIFKIFFQVKYNVKSRGGILNLFYMRHMYVLQISVDNKFFTLFWEKNKQLEINLEIKPA